jgi:hypothetical protein
MSGYVGFAFTRMVELANPQNSGPERRDRHSGKESNPTMVYCLYLQKTVTARPQIEKYGVLNRIFIPNLSQLQPVGCGTLARSALEAFSVG